MRALARDPAERFSTAAELQHALEGYLETSSVRSSSRQIGQFLTEQFREERSRIRETVETQVRRVSSATGSFVAPPLIPVLREDDDDSSPATSNDPEAATGDATAHPSAAGASGAAASFGRGKTAVTAVAGAAATLLVVALATHRPRSEPGEQPPGQAEAFS